MKTIIIGTGPSGLLAAYVLALYGDQVTILEKEPVIGGRLRADMFSDGTTLSVGATWIQVHSIFKCEFPLKPDLPRNI